MFQPKPIAHGTKQGYQQEVYRGAGTCPDCRTAWREHSRNEYHTNERFRQQRLRADQRSRKRRQAEQRRGKLSDVIHDWLETLERQWGSGVPMAVLVDSVIDRHSDLKPESVGRTTMRMVDAGEVVRYRLTVDDVRYRLP